MGNRIGGDGFLLDLIGCLIIMSQLHNLRSHENNFNPDSGE
jgi:hypothetical protein